MMGQRVLSAAFVGSVVWAACMLCARGDEVLPTALAGLDAPTANDEHAEPTPAPSRGPSHEALLAPGAAGDEKERASERVPKAPPAPVAERPGAGPSKPEAQWVSGYWAWDKPRQEYVWVTGAWQVPPTGKFWVNGYWRRDGRGWYRVPGFWSARVDGNEERRPDWKKDGPPVPPEEDVSPAPAPDHFYVAGVYAPDPKGQGLVWQPGFWYPTQPGWEWVPARWVRRSSGWSFREGSWQRTELAVAEGDDKPAPTRTAFPPGYPPPGYGYRPGPVPFGRIGGLLNQILP